jgi:hypothetical protein
MLFRFSSDWFLTARFVIAQTFQIKTQRTTYTYIVVIIGIIMYFSSFYPLQNVKFSEDLKDTHQTLLVFIILHRNNYLVQRFVDVQTVHLAERWR